MSLSHRDVQDILKLLEESDYDELNLETERFTLTLQRGDGIWTQETTTGARDKEQETRGTSIDSVEKNSETPPSEEGLLEVRAPMVGTYYRAPKPGADAFVEIGSPLASGTVIGIIEVMKLMNSVPSGVAGKVVEILAEDAQFVDKGQLLMRVRPN